jgi:cyclopropane fatty-acyl-phospholipid synthase-like methyltransferase
MNYTEPYISTPEDIIPRMLTLASVKPNEMLFDLGSGDGRVVITAARDFHARVVGVEIRRRLVTECRRKVREMGLSQQVTIRYSNFKE